MPIPAVLSMRRTNCYQRDRRKQGGAVDRWPSCLLL